MFLCHIRRCGTFLLDLGIERVELSLISFEPWFALAVVVDDGRPFCNGIQCPPFLLLEVFECPLIQIVDLLWDENDPLSEEDIDHVLVAHDELLDVLLQTA